MLTRSEYAVSKEIWGDHIHSWKKGDVTLNLCLTLIPDSEVDTASRISCWVGNAERRLYLDELAVVLGHKDSDRNYIVAHILNCGSLLRIYREAQRESVDFVYVAFRDKLFAQDASRKKEFRIDRESLHLELAHVSLEYLMRYMSQKEHTGHHFWNYSSKFWLAHYREGKQKLIPPMDTFDRDINMFLQDTQAIREW